MAFEKSRFIKADAPFVRGYTDVDLAPMLRGRFALGNFERAELRVCGLGYGHYWLNGQCVTEDKFIAPFGDYEKTLWYTAYDVTDLLRPGEDVCAAWLGNGFFNESLKTSWDFDAAVWRDNPKLLLELVVDGNVAFVSDGGWRCKADSAITFNQLRSGEYFDARLYDPGWVEPDYDDAGWATAVVDENPPKGVLRLCACQPIRECAVYPAVDHWKVGEGRYVFDVKQNMMGYVRLKIKGEPGDVVTIRYAERIHENGELNQGRMGEHYPESPFMTDRFTCDGTEQIWSPRFVYQGFRYIELDGLRGAPENEMVAGVFVHQAVDYTSEFSCSDEVLNRLFEIGRLATLSNLAYMPTDCPTREKLGWANDAQASAEQMITNFDIAPLFKKWLVDIFDAMSPEGALPGIIPTAGWGFKWGNGPVSDGILFELPYVVYLFKGDKQPLVDARPYFRRYLDYLKTREENDGMVSFGLSDWSPPRKADPPRVPTKLINTALTCKFLRIAALAAEVSGDEQERTLYETEWRARRALFMRNYLSADGRCTIDEQTAVSMAIFHDLYDDLTPLKAQLLNLVERFDFHHDCGMVGLRHLYVALTRCGAPDYAYRVITAQGYPGYRVWLDGGATTLWETWQAEDSYNHHMFSDFMSWLIKGIAGIRPVIGAPGFEKAVIEPAFIEELAWAKGVVATGKGKISSSWRRDGDAVALAVSVPPGVEATVVLPQGDVVLIGPVEGVYRV